MVAVRRTRARGAKGASAVDCVRGRLSVLVSRVCVCHQPIPHDARECIVGLRSAAVTPIAPPSVVCRVSDVGARLRLVWAASAEYYCYCYAIIISTTHWVLLYGSRCP